MFKHAVSLTLQTLLLLAVFLAGSLLPGLNRLPMWRVALGPGRFFVLDGLLLLGFVYLLLLGLHLATGSLRRNGPLGTLALLIALVLGLVMKFPFMGA